jgi:hypothetical protein
MQLHTDGRAIDFTESIAQSIEYIYDRENVHLESRKSGPLEAKRRVISLGARVTAVMISAY